MDEKIFETAEASSRLQNISSWKPELQDKFMVGFCSFLGKRIGSGQIYPSGYLVAFALALEDVKRGVDGFTGQSISHEFPKQHPMMYSILWHMKILIAEATFGKEFAELVSVQVELAGA